MAVFVPLCGSIEFEADIIRERIKAGLEAARARGRKGGRPKGLSNQAKDKAMIAENLYKERKLSTKQICEHLSASKMTLYNYLRHRGIEVGEYRKFLRIIKFSFYYP